MEEDNDLGTRLQQRRKAVKLTQESVASRIGVSVGLVRRYESNEVVPPTDKLMKMAVLYNTSMDYLCSLDNRYPIFIDDLPPAQQQLVLKMLETLKDGLISLATEN